MKRVVAALLLAALTLTGCGSGEATRDVFAMDTLLQLRAYGANADEALRDAEETVHAAEACWSVTLADSELYRVNHSGGQPVELSDETAKLLDFTLQMAKQTDGALDPTVYPALTAWGFTTGEYRVPTDGELREKCALIDYRRVELQNNTVRLPVGAMLDFGAVAKGYVGDLLAEQLKEAGISHALLSLGGNVQAVGTRPDGKDWQVGVRDPQGDDTVGTLAVRDAAVVTSGNYERAFTAPDGTRYGHILDPATGRPVQNGLASVTVTAPQGKLCDALSTALFVMGAERAAAYWRAHRDFEMVLVFEDGSLQISDGLASRFTPDAAFADRVTRLSPT